MRNPAAEMIVAAVGFAICVVVSLSLGFGGHPGWGCVFAGVGVAYAIVFAVAHTDLKEERRKAEIARSYVPSPPDFPAQRKHPIR